MHSNTELRRLERKSVDQKICVQDTVYGDDLGQLVNAHEEGFMLIGSGNIRKDCVYQLMFSIEATQNEDSLSLNVGAECLWTKETDSGSQFWAGFHIIDLGDADRQKLKKIVGS